MLNAEQHEIYGGCYMWEYLGIYTKKFDVYLKMWLFLELRQLLLRVLYVDLSKRTFWKTFSQTRSPNFRPANLLARKRVQAR